MNIFVYIIDVIAKMRLTVYTEVAKLKSKVYLEAKLQSSSSFSNKCKVNMWYESQTQHFENDVLLSRYHILSSAIKLHPDCMK